MGSYDSLYKDGDTLLKTNGEGISVGFLHFEEAVRDEDEGLKKDAEKKAKPEGPNVGLCIGEDDADSGH